MNRQPFDRDRDNDGIVDTIDNCPDIFNPDQADNVGNGIGDACRGISGSLDSDGDGVSDPQDNCPNDFNPDQADLDSDGIGDVCDPDMDGDGIRNEEDNCPRAANLDSDRNGNGLDDACDPDIDGDGIPNEDDNCPSMPNPDQSDIDGDGIAMYATIGSTSAVGQLSFCGLLPRAKQRRRLGHRRIVSTVLFTTSKNCPTSTLSPDWSFQMLPMAHLQPC